jgi:hypothetical protein
LTGKSTRRRTRKADPLASADAVRYLLAQLVPHLPDEMRWSEKNLVSLLRAVRHVERYPASDTRRGRPGKFDRELLLKINSTLRSILERETSGRTAVASFVDHYLRILSFPADVLEPLDRGDVNIFEAEQLARVTASRLGVSESQARKRRAELLTTHLQARLSASRLRVRVNEMLGMDISPTRTGEVPMPADELEDFDPHDPTHLFYDEIKRLGFALREIRPGDLSDELLEEFLSVSEPLWSVIGKIEKRKAHKVAKLLV